MESMFVKPLAQTILKNKVSFRIPATKAFSGSFLPSDVFTAWPRSRPLLAGRAPPSSVRVSVPQRQPTLARSRRGRRLGSSPALGPPGTTLPHRRLNHRHNLPSKNILVRRSFFFFLFCSQNQCGFFSDFSWALLGLSRPAWIHGCRSSVMSPLQTRSLFAHFPPDLDNFPAPTTTVPCPLGGKGCLRGLSHLCQHSPLDRMDGSWASGSVGRSSCLIKGNQQKSKTPACLPLSRECIYSQPAADPE